MRVDDRNFPLVSIEFPQHLGPELPDQVAALGERLFARETPFVMLVDLRKASVPDAMVRWRTAEVLNRREMTERQHLALGAACVVSSAAIRAAIKALFWLWRTPIDVEIGGSIPDGARWAQNRLLEANVAMSPECEARLRTLVARVDVAAGRRG